MKIGILTYHYATNYGAFFQAQSLHMFLKDHGYDAQIINYIDNKHLWYEYKLFFFHKRYLKRPMMALRNFNKFNNFKKAQRLFNFKERYRKASEIKGFDVIIIGSDIVWNYQYHDLDNPIYFGIGLENTKIISYAPSCGGLDLSKEIPQYVKDGLFKFSEISVRDSKTASFVNSILGFKPKIVIDPTLLYPPIDKSNPPEKSEYMLIYGGISDNLHVDKIAEYAKKSKLQIISVGYKNDFASKNLVSIGPLGWLSYFNHAKYIVTNTFHGTLFSIIFHKNFCTINRPAISTKIEFILNQCKLENRVINREDDSVMDVLNTNPDYELADKVIHELQEDSKKFLLHALKS